MQIERSAARKVVINGAKALDPITVFIEDFDLGQGSITLTCYGKAWTAYWGAMGNRTVSQFFCGCDEGYIANRMGVSKRDYAYLCRIILAVKAALLNESE